VFDSFAKKKRKEEKHLKKKTLFLDGTTARQPRVFCLLLYLLFLTFPKSIYTYTHTHPSITFTHPATTAAAPSPSSS
jgi:hypothetical protein